MRTFVNALLLIAAPFVTACASSTASAADPTIGTYHWPIGTAGVDAFADWLNRPAVWGVDFVGSESWNNIEWPVWWLDAWSQWTHARPGRRLILSIPMLPGPIDGSGPTEGSIDPGKPVSLSDGAAGHYNHHFKQLAENLVAHKLGAVILRPGWEFNGSWFAWRAKGHEKDFAEYWRQIVRTIRAVPDCEGVQFCWNPTLGDQDFPADSAWPGDAFVDYVGVDVYDETWNPETYPWPATATPEEIASRQRKVWDEWLFYSPRGLKFWAEFARQHHKPLSIPEWGLNHRRDGHGGMDNPYFVEQMYRYISDPANGVTFHCYFDVNDSGESSHQLSPGPRGSKYREGTEFPVAAARFRELFGIAKE